MPTIQLIIKGKVQGVFYRASAKKVAERLGISGWIRNMEEGGVEAMVTGDDGQLQEFISWCRKGPDNAKVSEVIDTKKEDVSFDKFEIV